MKEIKFVHKRIGNDHLVWFKNSNLYFKLEEPAWFVFSRVAKKQQSATIATEFSAQYKQSHEDSLRFVTELRERIDTMNYSPPATEMPQTPRKEISKQKFTAFSRHYYHLLNTVVAFSYETEWLENYIHPLLQHLKTDKSAAKKSEFELFTFENRVVFRRDDTVIGDWPTNKSEYVKGRILLELANVLYHKTDSDWLMTLHASAITNGHKTILFSAAPGSGKTTFAALLQAHGYRILSDDFVPLQQGSFNAYPLPLAMSVKPGSLDLLTELYPELKNSQLTRANTNKIVKYLPIDAETTQMVFPVNEIVFIKYDSAEDFLLERVEPIDALNTIIDEAWIPPTPENVEKFMERVAKTSFYKLTYSNNKKAINAITQMFENDQ